MAIHSVAAGDIIFATDINALVTALTPVVVTTTATIGTVATGFSVSDVRAVTMADGKVVQLDLAITVTTAINANSATGNIPDTTCFTLATAYRPSHTFQSSYDASGTESGGATFNTDGTVQIRTTNNNVASGAVAIPATQLLRISAMYVLG